MYCRKCGAQNDGDAKFCNDCGEKFINRITEQSKNTVDESRTERNENSFKEYVDSHVRRATKFKSAEDLLKNSRPLIFVWICFGVGALISILAVYSSASSIITQIDSTGNFKSEDISWFVFALLFLALTVVFGMPPAWITGIVKRVKINRRMKSPRSHPAVEVNLSEIVVFLRTNLQYLSPYFNNWEVTEKTKSIWCTVRSKKVKAVIEFGVNHKNERFYQISAKKANVLNYIVISGSGISGGKTNAGFGEYRCLYMAAPILTAAVEYYLKSAVAQETPAPVLS